MSIFRPLTFYLIFLLAIGVSCSKDNLELENCGVSYNSSNFEILKKESTLIGVERDDNGNLVIVESNGNNNSFGRNITSLKSNGDINWSLSLLDDDFQNFKRTSITKKSNSNLLVTYNVDDPWTSNWYLKVMEISSNGNIIRDNISVESPNRILPVESIVLPNSNILVLCDYFNTNFNQSELATIYELDSGGELIDSTNIQLDNTMDPEGFIYDASDNTIIMVFENDLLISNEYSVTVRKYSLNGTLIWKQDILASGTLWSFSSSIISLNPTEYLVMFTSDRIAYLHKMNIFGDILWTKEFRGDGSELIRDVISNGNDSHTILGSTSSCDRDDFNLRLYKIDSNQEIIWDNNYGGELSDQASNLFINTDGSYFILGASNEGNNSDTKFDIIALNTDQNGEPQ